MVFTSSLDQSIRSGYAHVVEFMYAVTHFGDVCGTWIIMLQVCGISWRLSASDNLNVDGPQLDSLSPTAGGRPSRVVVDEAMPTVAQEEDGRLNTVDAKITAMTGWSDTPLRSEDLLAHTARQEKPAVATVGVEFMDMFQD